MTTSVDIGVDQEFRVNVEPLRRLVGLLDSSKAAHAAAKWDELHRAFVWLFSPEGFDYWHSMCGNDRTDGVRVPMEAQAKLREYLRLAEAALVRDAARLRAIATGDDDDPCNI